LYQLERGVCLSTPEGGVAAVGVGVAAVGVAVAAVGVAVGKDRRELGASARKPHGDR
jgi:hypothetical protein